MKFLAAFTNRKVVGSKPTQIPITRFDQLSKKLGFNPKETQVYERENVYNGKYYGRYAMVSGAGVECDEGISSACYTPDQVADVLRRVEGDFVYVRAGRREVDRPTARYMDLLVASVGIPVYRSDVRYVSWFSTDREILLELGGSVDLVQPYSLYSCCNKDHIPLQTMATGKRVALEFSGGIGSLVAARILRDQGYNPQLIHFLEGRPDRARQVMLMGRDLGLEVDMHKLPNPANALVEPNQSIPTDLPTTLTRLGFSTYWGMKVGCHYMATGDTAENASTIRAKSEVLRVCAPRLYHLEYIGPVAGKTKPELLKMAIKANLPLFRARSCLTTDTHCGWCEKCQAWRAAYDEIGEKDPRTLL